MTRRTLAAGRWLTLTLALLPRLRRRLLVEGGLGRAARSSDQS